MSLQLLTFDLENPTRGDDVLCFRLLDGFLVALLADSAESAVVVGSLDGHFMMSKAGFRYMLSGSFCPRYGLYVETARFGCLANIVGSGR